TPTGTVDFVDLTTGADLGSATLDSRGIAQSVAIAASRLTNHDIQAVYSGSGGLATSSASQVVGSGSASHNATTTAQDVMASPDAVGNTLADSAGATGLGQRDLIGLAFNDSGTVVPQASLSSLALPVVQYFYY